MIDAERAQRNLEKTLEIIGLAFSLKEAYVKTRHPELSPAQVRKLIYDRVIEAKMRAWKSDTTSKR